MKKIILLSLCVFLYSEQAKSEVLDLTSGNSIYKQDPKGGTQTSHSVKKKSKRNKKADQNEMLDKKISISDENQPINKGKSKKGK
jgi:hypothetical protein